ncbi:MAG: alpha/beta hydrolase [Chloroflexi bacterium]|nr:MAG: alpha/beta hydrolase [Chloroflexota bacterium]
MGSRSGPACAPPSQPSASSGSRSWSSAIVRLRPYCRPLLWRSILYGRRWNDVSALETTNRVQVAASHWRPRFVANGIDVNDFDDTVVKTTEWKDWGPNWKAVGEMHEALGLGAEAHGRTLSATQAYQRAAWSYHLGKFLWFEDLHLHAELRDRAVSVYRRALPHLAPPAERLEIPFEGRIVPANLRRPAGLDRPPLVLLVPGLDSSKEELYAIEQDFLFRGMATLTIDGPGQSENAVHFAIRPNWETVITPVLDHLDQLQPGVDLGRIGLMGISMGAIYGPRAAAHEKRLRAVVGLAGPYNLGECWDGLNPLTKGGYIFYTKSGDEGEAKRKAFTFNLEGVLGRVTQPLLVIHGARDRLFPPAQAERIAREAPAATLVMYPDGNHVCNNIAYKYRPLMADWMKDRLG